MIEHARPTRAEATDIFHSVSSSADAIMLSGETAVGKYTIESVAMMARVIINAEAYLWQQGAFYSGEGKAKYHQAALPFGSAVARSTSLLSRDLMVHGIVVLSESGWTTVTVSSERPEAPILAVTSSEETCRRMNLIWGVIPVLVEVEDMGSHVTLAKSLVQKYNLAKVGDPILLVQGFHRDEANNCPSIMVLKV
jgi:pyruvate kinase